MDIFFTGGQELTLPFGAIAARLILATIFGAVIGFEREWRERPAGLRTHILICLASALFSILTIEIIHLPVFSDESVKHDPIRLVEAVTAGIAFLAAGVVIFTRGEVHGLTTGAGMWLAGSIGLACGLGLWQIGLLATLLAVLVLGVLHQVEKRFGLNRNNRIHHADEKDSPDQG